MAAKKQTAKKPVGNRLTGKQRQFVNLYVANGFNGFRAAKAAGYKGSDDTLRTMASENLTKPNIKAAIEAHMKAMAMPADEALARISTHARSDMRDLMGLTFDQIQQHPQAAAIKKMKQRFIFKEDGSRFGEMVEVELYDAQTALNTIARHHGLLKDGVTININIELIVQAVQALEQAGLDPAQAFERLIERAHNHAASLIPNR